ncbi:hypothetical protein [Maribacter aquivivus]|uniref:hypothetical protein n=1 Tax=Maribacter TaxID=252356 RepID=UPI0037CC3617
MQICITFGQLAILGHSRSFKHAVFIVIKKSRNNIFYKSLTKTFTCISRQFAR